MVVWGLFLGDEGSMIWLDWMEALDVELRMDVRFNWGNGQALYTHRTHTDTPCGIRAGIPT